MSGMVEESVQPEGSGGQAPEHGRRLRSKALQAQVDALDALQAFGRERGHDLHDVPVSELRGGSRVVIRGREMAMFASYSYLGLIGHPRINAAAHEAIERYGTGTHGARMLAGTLEVHHELERELAAFKRTADAVTFTSGFAANVATISALVGKRDVVLCDKLDHASIVDGCQLSGAAIKRFRHNDMDHLAYQLERCAGFASRLVVVDAVFSMDGDIVDLPRVMELCRRYDALLMVDEAHATGVLGATGRGIEEHFGLPADAIDVKMGTLSKAIPSAGGYIAGARGLVNLLRCTARAAVYSGSLSPMQSAAALAALRLLLDEPERVATVQANARRFAAGLGSAGLDTMNSQTPIVPVLLGDELRAYDVAAECTRRGVFVLPVISPTVPKGQARLRATVTAAHTPEQMDEGIRTIAEAVSTVAGGAGGL